MDINSKIIEAVKQKPCLYGRNSKMQEREIGWRELSKELKMKEQYLKIRWHFLVQRYRTDDFFKYANQMHFVQRNIELKVRSGKWPEFEITEDDIAERRTNNTEEYVFLEVDDLENNSQQNPSDSLEGFSMKCESSDVSNKCQEAVENYNTHEENISAPITTNKQNITLHSESNKINIATKNTVSDRCEDVIFGELVTAMLKGMEDGKKRNIKKEIMNLLLT